jgi:hypothetical protein
MPDKWIPCNGRHLEGDVIRWKQPIWPERKTRKPDVRGECLVTAEVLKPDRAGYVRLGVKEVEVIYNKYGIPLKTFKVGEVIRKQPATLTKGEAERRPWGGKDGESARALAVSRFMRADENPPSPPKPPSRPRKRKRFAG